MTRHPCPREPEVCKALQTDRWNDDLEAHLTSCPSCADLQLVQRSLEELADLTQPLVAQMPNPSLIWQRAQRLERAESLRRATWPILLVERLAIGCGVVGAAIVAARLWPTARGWFQPWVEMFSGAAGAIPDFSNTSLLVLLAGTALGLLLLGLNSSWAES